MKVRVVCPKKKSKVRSLGFHSHHPSQATNKKDTDRHKNIPSGISLDSRLTGREREKEREGKKKEGRPANKFSSSFLCVTPRLNETTTHEKREREREKFVNLGIKRLPVGEKRKINRIEREREKKEDRERTAAR